MSWASPTRNLLPEHLLGTNDVGQDIFSELLYGARVSLTIGIVSSLVITVFGTGVGLISAYFGGDLG